MKDKPRILIIDDEEVMCDSCRQVCRKEGYSVETALNGEKGIKKTIEKKPDLVLIDLKMPGMNGIEVLERIKDINPGIVPIIITGYATIDSAVKAMKLGAYDYIPKPFTPEELREITRKGLEKRKQIAEKNRLRKTKEKFISMITHQLKTPLAAVVEYIEVLLGGYTGAINQEQHEILNRSKIRLEELLNLIKDWLKLSGISREKLQDRMKPVSINEVISDSLDAVREQADNKNIKVNINTDDNLPLIQGEKKMLNQLFINLLENGITYNKNDGKLEVTSEIKNDSLIVHIKDTGMGIPEDKIPYIFEQFYRVEDIAGKNNGGSGLGLSIADKIARAHSGKINVKSKIGEGSTFSVRLPLNNKEDK